MGGKGAQGAFVVLISGSQNTVEEMQSGGIPVAVRGLDPPKEQWMCRHAFFFENRRESRAFFAF
jgi:hypothetical protein